MIFSKYDRCYEEGKETGFVQFDCIDKDGKKRYKKCPGEEYSPGKICKKCLNCCHIDTKNARNRQKIAEDLRIKHYTERK